MGIEETLKHIHESTQLLIGQNKALLEFMEQQKPKEEEAYLSFEQCAELLSISKATVRKCVAMGMFKTYKFRGLTRVKRSEVMAAIEKGEIKTKRK